MLQDAPRAKTTAIDGLLLVDKPRGVTSHDVVGVARRALRTRRVGHTGTLDPFATGLLVLLVGRATRLASYVDDEPKVYEATIAFGAETTTDDLTGEITRTAELPSVSDVDRAIVSLTGQIEQRPPDFSAKQIAGRRAYAAARAGEPLALAPVNVIVHDWRVRHRTPSTLDVTITCGGGTYIRALARDLGRGTNSAAHLTALRRIRAGGFDLAAAVTVATLEEVGAAALVPLRSAIAHLPVQLVDGDELRRAHHGNPIEARIDAPLVALVDLEGNLIGIARREATLFQPRVVMRDE
jgi:tRNA pseudouridine55 synthase